MIITNKNRIETNVQRLDEFFGILSPSFSFLQSKKLFNLRSSLQTELTGIIYNQSYEVICNHNNRSINAYFKRFADDKDCTISVKELCKPKIPLLIIPSEYSFESVLTAQKTIKLENDLFVDEKDIPESYIDFSWKNAAYHYATYTFLDYMFNKLKSSIQSSKYRNIDFWNWRHGYFNDEIKFYKNRLIKLGLLSSNKSIQEQSKMIVTASDMLYCDESYLEEHHCTVRISSAYFVQGGDTLDRSASMISNNHNASLRNEVRQIHNPLFEKYME